MNLELAPNHPSVAIKTLRFALPLTPFFSDPASAGNARTRSFNGDDFLPQFKNTREFKEDGTLKDEPICGFAAYRVSTSVDFDTDNPPLSNGTLTKSYVFDENPYNVRIETVEEGRHSIGLVHTCTANTAKQGNAFEDPPTHVEITRSESVDKGWLAGQLSRWIGESDDFRAYTGFGLSTYAYVGQGATRSESDGWNAIVGGGDVIAKGPSFWGEEADKWNGNFSTFVNLARRKNAPIIYHESSVTDGHVSAGGAIAAAAEGVYRAGYAEMELSDPVDDLWMDGYGVFRDSEALDSFPMSPVMSSEFSQLIWHTHKGSDNELTIISRTGKNYRLTIQVGAYTFEEPGEPEWVASQTHVLATDPTSLTATFTLTRNEDDDAWDVRVSIIEEEIEIEGEPSTWKVIADADAYAQYQEELEAWQAEWNAWNEGGRVGDAPAMPDTVTNPATLIGPDVVGNYLLLAAMKVREGSRFGFSPLIYSPETADNRYRKCSFKLHLTPGAVENSEGSCGVSTLSGSADLEWNEEYDIDTGLINPREVTQWSLTLDGKDWTQEDYSQFNNLYFYGANTDTQTETKIKNVATNTFYGRFVVAFDSPDPNGKIVSSAWSLVSMNHDSDADENRTAAVSLNPPASGQSVFFEGHRLTYDAGT